MNKTYDVIGIGVSTIDLLNVVDHFPDKEEVQKSIYSTMLGGGPVATAIVTLSRLGAKTAMIDSIGDDWFGEQIVSEFEKENVDTRLIKINPVFTSSSAVILVRKNDGARTVIYTPGNSPDVSTQEISSELISQAKFIHINGRHFDACLKACEIAKHVGTKISFDGGSYRFSGELRKIIQLADFCVVAKEFASCCTGEKEITAAAKQLLNSGPDIVIITDGLNGSFLFTKEINGYHQKAFIMENTVDTTGFGDSYHGAFLFGLTRGYDLYESMKIAAAVSAINSTQLGGRTALPDFKTVKIFLEKY